jgi:hypothetical protein
MIKTTAPPIAPPISATFDGPLDSSCVFDCSGEDVEVAPAAVPVAFEPVVLAVVSPSPDSVLVGFAEEEEKVEV